MDKVKLLAERYEREGIERAEKGWAQEALTKLRVAAALRALAQQGGTSTDE